MSELSCIIRGVDTLLFRDGRPFGGEAGERADTLNLPVPSTLAGFLRTKHGALNGDWAGVSDSIHVWGPLLMRNGGVVLPAPADALVTHPGRDRSRVSVTRLLPWSRAAFESAGAGTDIPGGMLPMKVPVSEKPAGGFEFWSWRNVAEWLGDAPQQTEYREVDLKPRCYRIEDGAATPPQAEDFEADLAPPVDYRVHVKMDGKTGTGEEGKLFSTSMVAFEKHAWERMERQSNVRFDLLCQVRGVEDESRILGPGVFGGENRAAVVSRAAPGYWPACPHALAARLASARRVRMLLATPAIFEHGWIPQWLDKTTKTGSPPGLKGRLALKLTAAAVPRRQAVSGWEISGAGPGRPKPVRWCAPAGSVYFFEVVSGDPALLAGEGWLASVSDDEETRTPGRTLEKNRADGFGLALWGIWDDKEGAS